MSAVSKTKRKVLKHGGGGGIYLSKEELERLGIEVGDKVELTVTEEGLVTIKKSVEKYTKFLKNVVEGGVNLGEALEIGGSQIIPIFAKKVRSRDYVTVKEALERGWLDFHDTGGISRVSITNVGEKPILVVQGQVLVGGTQPRTVISNMLITPGRTVDVPARCVHDRRAIVAGAGMRPQGLAPRTVAFHLSAPAAKVSQSKVWGDIRCLMGTTVWLSSNVQTLAPQYRAHAEVMSVRTTDLANYTEAFSSIARSAMEEEKRVKKRRKTDWSHRR